MDTLVQTPPHHEILREVVARIGPFEISYTVSKITCMNDARLRFSAKESLFLALLLSTPNTFVPRKRILEVIWPGSPRANSHTLETHKYRVVQKLFTVPGVSIRTDNIGYGIFFYK